METVMFRNLDANFDIFNTELEKHIGRLPENMRFIKKLVYYDLLPKVFNTIRELELLKQSSKYDEALVKVKPQSVMKLNELTCIDMFENNNIKSFTKSNKLVYGTLTGTIAIYDYEQQRVCIEKALPGKGRVDIIATATIKYFDIYISRIAVYVRGETSIQVYTYNHSYSVINQETVIALTNEKVLSLSHLVSHMKFSKDSFFLSVIDYSGGVRVYRFADIPQGDGGPERSASNNMYKITSGSTLDNKKIAGNEIPANYHINNSSNNNNNAQNCILLFQTKYTDPDNFTIITINKPPEDPKSLKDKKQAEVKTKQAGDNKGKNDKPDNKLSSNNLKTLNKDTILVPDDINIKTIFDEGKSDLTPLRLFNKNLPLITFVQKKIIFEDKTGGFCSSLVTVGLYIGYYGTSSLKFYSLFPYLTENMKTVFKVSKVKGGSSLVTLDEAMSMHSNMNKREKEFLAFVKAKLDGTVPADNKELKPTSKKTTTKDLHTVKKEEIIKSKEPEVKKEAVNLNDYTRNEIGFGLLNPITALVGQKSFNSTNNLLAIGMKDGSVVVWDAELHSDRYLFQANRGEITSLAIDENYLTCGSIDGQLQVYNLTDGSMVYNSHHYPYINNPICNVSIN
jgi:hypothetical protein